MTPYEKEKERVLAEFDKLSPPLKSEQEWMREWELFRELDQKTRTDATPITATELMLAQQNYHALLGRREELRTLVSRSLDTIARSVADAGRVEKDTREYPAPPWPKDTQVEVDGYNAAIEAHDKQLSDYGVPKE